MRRRDFITLLSSAALAWCTKSYAQTPDKVHRAAVISPTATAIENWRREMIPELAGLGFTEGRNLVVTYHIGLPIRMPELAREALAARPDVVVATSDIAIREISAASSSVPIVMAFGGRDPVALGLAQSLGRPGGNVTGVWMRSHDLDRKRLLLLHEATPMARRIAVLAGRPPMHVEMFKEIRQTASELGLDARAFLADGPADYASAFAEMRAAHVEALAIPSSPVFFRDAAILSQLALEARLPTVCEWASMARDGCLIGYGPSRLGLVRRVTDYIARILRGTAPGELPIEQPTKFEVGVNLRTAKVLGLSVPPTLIALADEVIE